MTNALNPFDALMDITARPPAGRVRARRRLMAVGRQRQALSGLMQGWAVNCLGHAPPALAEALAAQAKLLLTPSPAFYNAPSLKLARMLIDHSCFDRVFFANSGGEANEGAIKLARRYGALHKNGAYEIITFVNSFHGRTLATMSASGKKAFEPLFEPKVPGFPKAITNDLESVKRLITDKTVAVMLEPIQGEAGVWAATDQFLGELRALTTQHGLLLILDEIQTGIGRTGKLFHYEHTGIEPDIMTLGKGIGGGVPLAALLATEHASCFQHGDQGGTFNGNPLMCAAGLAVLEQVVQPAFLKATVEAGLLLESELQRLSARHGLGEVRGRGLLLALDLKRPIGASVVAQAFEAGVLLNSPQPDALRFMPALNVSREEISAMIECLDTIFNNADAARCVA
jgi:acetylornithine/N-succinyldiaminopimelate aminotransferase